MAEDIVKLLSPLSSPITLVFFYSCADNHSKANPVSGAQNTRVGEIGYFRLKSPFISETVLDRPMVTMER